MKRKNICVNIIFVTKRNTLNYHSWVPNSKNNKLLWNKLYRYITVLIYHFKPYYSKTFTNYFIDTAVIVYRGTPNFFIRNIYIHFS